MSTRISHLGARVETVPTAAELPRLVAAIAQHWAAIHLRDPALARELLRRLPKMQISTNPPETMPDWPPAA